MNDLYVEIQKGRESKGDLEQEGPEVGSESKSCKDKWMKSET